MFSNIYKKNRVVAKRVKSQITRNPDQTGKSIEEQIRQAIATNEPIEANAPMIYTEKKEGVNPAYDIRADRQELALDAINKFDASQMAKKEETPITNNEQKTEE